MKRFRVLSCVLVLLLLLTPTTVIAAEKHVVVYTALGDSIAAGTGGTGGIGYADLLAKRLARGNRGVTFNDMGVNGLTSADLVARLAFDGPTQGAVAGADIITVSIGGNDLLQPALAFVTMKAAYAGFADPVTFLATRTDAEKYALGAELYADLSPRLAAFSGNWGSAAGAIKALNPDASVYVSTLYNPFVRGDGLYEIVDPYLAGINGVLAAGAPLAGYTVVDVYAGFAAYDDPAEPLVHGLTSPLALHPTDEGFRLIYRLHCGLLKKGPF